MRPVFWSIDSVQIDLEDRDASVKLVHGPTLASVVVEFRLTEAALAGSVDDLKRRVEHLARESVLDLASFFDSH